MKRTSYMVFFLVAFCYATGLILHFSYRLLFLGFVFIGIGLVIAYMQKVRALDCEVESASLEDKGWEVISEDNFRALLEKARKIEEVSGNTRWIKVIFNNFLAILFIIILYFAMYKKMSVGVLFRENEAALYLILLMDLTLIIRPIFLFFNPEVKTPGNILTKLKAFSAFAEELGMGFAWRYEVKFEEQKSLDMDNHVKSLRSLTDVRVKLDYIDKDKDWVSLSFICNVNKVKGVEYPFVYAVMVGKKGSRICEELLNYSWDSGWYSQSESKGEYDVTVILPYAYHKSYYTNSEKVGSLIRQVVNVILRA